MKRHTNIVASYLVLLQNNKVLLSKRSNTGYMDEWYSLVAGHVEDNETFSQALIREVKEEIGIDVSIKDIKHCHVMHRHSSLDGSQRVDAFFLVEAIRGKIVNLEPHKCSQLEWFDLDNLPNNIIPYVKLALRNTLLKKSYSEYGWKE